MPVDTSTVYRNIVWLLLLSIHVGCSSSAIPSSVVESSQSKFDQAQSLLALKDYAGALPLLDEAIANGGLDADFAFDSIVSRARCYIELGKLPEALADIDSAAAGATDMAIIHGLRYQYWMKSGESAKAQAELRLAQKMNPSFRVP
jgi:tetratricopeptide (TPR) repeat protein